MASSPDTGDPTLWPPGSPASPPAKQGGARRSKTRAGSGRKLPDAFALYDPPSCSWRTPSDSLAGDSTSFSGSWPRSGSMRAGIAYRRPTWVPPTSATASSSWHTVHGQGEDGHGSELSMQVKRAEATWPTPKASNGDKAGRPRPNDWGDLQAEVLRWPTPMAHDDGKSPEAHLAMKARMPGGPRQTITSLTVMVKAINQGRWPTPTSSNAQGGPGRPDRVRHGQNLREATAGALNPEWVEMLQGFPAGWTATVGPLRPARSSTRGSRRARSARASPTEAAG